MYDKNFKKIEYYLYNYNLIDYKISLFEDELTDYNYHQTYNIWIKDQSNSLENEAIRNIVLEQKIYNARKWQSLITTILEHYKTKDKIKYKFICLKYFKKLTPIKIQERINLTKEEQENLKVEILNYILVVAIKKDMLKEVEI